ncbi:hypothetical protein PILCRDRAFT_62997, partial [Piloderma croceum F 1598]
QHGKVAFVNLEAVKRERLRIARKLEKYLPKNCLNVDEAGIFGQAPPDQGLATSQMSGKKSNCSCITVTFICNQDGSEKWQIFYIGKFKQPWCFKKRKPAEYGFCY